MELNDWFTIISILLAVFAFFSQEERKILLLKTNKYQVWSTIFLLVVLVPLLLFFNNLSQVFPFLKKCPFTFNRVNLPVASTWAFLLTLSIIGYWFYWFSCRLIKTKPTEKLMEHYIKSMDTIPFETLFKLFIKYEGIPLEKSSNYSLYGIVLTNKSFFNSAFKYNPNLFSGIVKNIDTKTILDSELPRIIRDQMISIVSEQKRLGLISPYNYEPVSNNNSLKEDLLLFHLTNYYFLMMEQCIEENNFNGKNFQMLNYFSETIFSEILNSIRFTEEVDYNKETPTYFHKLLSNILSAFNDWISLSINLERETNIIEHFATLYSSCIVKLLKYNSDVITSRYIEIQFNSFLLKYFNELQSVEAVLTKIENSLVESLPKDINEKKYYKSRFESCWKYTDEGLFAGDSGVLEHEKSKQNRFIKNVVNKIITP